MEKYSFEYPIEINHCLKCPFITEGDGCKLNDDAYYKNWEEQIANCPLKKESEKTGCAFDE